MFHTHTCRHSVRCGLQLTSCSSRGSIIGASSALGDREGDEESLFSHSVRPDVSPPVSKKERFSSLMLVWCLTISAGGVMSYSSRSTILQGNEAGASAARMCPCFMYALVACISNKWIIKKKLIQCSKLMHTSINCIIHFIPCVYCSQAGLEGCEGYLRISLQNNNVIAKLCTDKNAVTNRKNSLYLNAKEAFRTSLIQWK